MAQMERKREKKARQSAEKPAAEHKALSQPQPDAGPEEHSGAEEKPGHDQAVASSQVRPAEPVSPKGIEPTSIAELEPVPTSRGRHKPRPLSTTASKAIAARGGFVVEPAAMEPEAAEEPATAPPAAGAGLDIVSAAVAGGEEQDDLSTVEYDDLTDIEKDVLRVAKNSLKKKRYEADIGFDPYTPMVEKIVGDCLAKYQAQKGYSKDGIIETLKALEEQRWIVTAERRTKEEILNDALYGNITRFLEAYPGTHARDDRVQQKLGITRNPFLKHVLVLDRFQLVKKYKFGKLWNFFAPSFNEDDKVAELVVVMYNDIVRQLIRLLLKNPGSTLVELAKSIIPPVYHGAIQYHLKKLEELGLVSRDGSDRTINQAMLQRYNDVVCAELKIA
ncbi:MAG: hypothetical protein JW839_17395 [Candidatus Lokiarchaeota archaeon]|nr:hypothetical protein [Candidatus Lokiarchaeota archaeon]